MRKGQTITFLGLAVIAGLVLAAFTSAPSLTISIEAQGRFVQGSQASYTITVGNAGYGSQGATNGKTVTVRLQLPAVLQAQSISQQGWNCNPATLTCTRSGVLASGSKYPPITLPVQVTCAASGTVRSTATVTGGGDTAIHSAVAETQIVPSEQCNVSARAVPVTG